VVRERSDPVAAEPEALRAWRSGACRARLARPRPRNPGQDAGTGPAGTPGSRGSVRWPTRRSGPGGAWRRSIVAARADRLSVARRACLANDPRWLARPRRRRAGVQGMTLFDNTVAAIVAPRRGGQSIAEVRRARVRGGASTTDHPPDRRPDDPQASGRADRPGKGERARVKGRGAGPAVRRRKGLSRSRGRFGRSPSGFIAIRGLERGLTPPDSANFQDGRSGAPAEQAAKIRDLTIP
jgi:hypothetical protein